MPDNSNKKEFMSPLEAIRKKLQDTKSDNQSPVKYPVSFEIKPNSEFVPSYAIAPLDATKAVQPPDNRRNPLSLLFNGKDSITVPIINERIQPGNEHQRNALSTLRRTTDTDYLNWPVPDSSADNHHRQNQQNYRFNQRDTGNTEYENWLLLNQSLSGEKGPGTNNPKGQFTGKLPKNKLDFYNEVAPKIIQAAIARGIPLNNAYLVLAHRLAENSYEILTKGNNQFNLKGSSPEGKSAPWHTHEDINGIHTQENDNFREYSSSNNGIDDYFSQLEKNWPEAYKALHSDNPNLNNFMNALDHGRLGKFSTAKDYHNKLKRIYDQVVKDINKLEKK
jgi:flagellum-specific peptidoglycan hydrolase FlgJ